MQSCELREDVWQKVKPHLPIYKVTERGGRPRLRLKKVFEGILFVLKNNIPWNAVPVEYGSGTALNDYFRYWCGLGVFGSLKNSQLLRHKELLAIESKWPVIAKTRDKHQFSDVVTLIKNQTIKKEGVVSYGGQ